MPASLETLDNIRERLNQSGIGTSGLADQAIARANLPELSVNLNESNNLYNNRKVSRLEDFQSRLKLQIAKSQESPAGVGGFDPSKPFLLGKTAAANRGGAFGDNAHAIAIRDPRTGRLGIQSVAANNPLVESATKNSPFGANTPIINTIYASSLDKPQYNIASLLKLYSSSPNLNGNTLGQITDNLIGRLQ